MQTSLSLTGEKTKKPSVKAEDRQIHVQFKATQLLMNGYFDDFLNVLKTNGATLSSPSAANLRNIKGCLLITVLVPPQKVKNIRSWISNHNMQPLKAVGD